jgi:glycosyltransferase involved in cell wall biosynthesis
MIVSVAIIAKNAEKDIFECLNSAKIMTDDVVVVLDSTSVDKTEQIAKKWGAKVFEHVFENFSQQKNLAASYCRRDWVFSLDADERISKKLANEILSLNDKPEISGYLIPRDNYIFGKRIKHSNWGSKDDTHLWLYRKSKGKWVNDVHEEVVVKGVVAKLAGSKIHFNYSSVTQFMDKLNDYTTREIKSQNPIYDFVRRYVWHLGFLDGWHGLFLGYLMMVYHLVVWVKLWQKKNIS